MQIIRRFLRILLKKIAEAGGEIVLQGMSWFGLHSHCSDYICFEIDDWNKKLIRNFNAKANMEVPADLGINLIGSLSRMRAALSFRIVGSQFGDDNETSHLSLVCPDSGDKSLLTLY